VIGTPEGYRRVVVPERVVDVLEARRLARTAARRVVDHDIEAAAPPDRGGHRGFDVGRDRDGAARPRARPPPRPDRGDGLGAVRAWRRNHALCPRRRAGNCDAPAQAAAGPGDEDAATSQRGRHGAITMPPSTGIVAPVTKCPGSAASNATTGATSV